VQDKLQVGQPVFEADLEFIDRVKMWVLMPAELREKYRTIDEMRKSGEMKGVTISDVLEANKRDILPKQWLDLLHVAKAANKSKEWIDGRFIRREGVGKIEVGLLDLHGCTALETLPADLRVRGHLDLYWCTSLKTLPAGLAVEGNLNLDRCTSLETIPADLEVRGDLSLEGCTSLETLPAGLNVGRVLYLYGCTSLRTLPAGLRVGSGLNLHGCTTLETLPADLQLGAYLTHLDVSGCTSLTSLPENLELGGYLRLSKDLNEQVKKEGKIKGEIRYE
jgi:hypothetical protein